MKNIEQQKQFDEELLITQQEIQEETLKQVGRELHDNVGQLLSVATMQMNSVAKVVDSEIKPKVASASEALKESLAEVRNLSRSLNSDVIANLGFEATVKNEIDRLNKSGLIEAKLNTVGERVNFENNKDEIILFRILQEFISNTLKYAEAELIIVSLSYDSSLLTITAEDNGVGFDHDQIEQGSGLTNMSKRSELINAEFQLESVQNEGTTLSLSYPYRTL
ncbi:sensor histidine kinase [Winogradskyella tangerina]|uniref:sensor histidine kinase n=1 Tax=Winogradskyella tangerina TaxID=2023240 RepID=UPI001E64B911|nr:histidine kinase [Winogradskyella tangerina]